MSKDFPTAPELAELSYASEHPDVGIRRTRFHRRRAALGRATPWTPSSATYSLPLPGSCSIPSHRNRTHTSRSPDPTTLSDSHRWSRYPPARRCGNPDLSPNAMAHDVSARLVQANSDRCSSESSQQSKLHTVRDAAPERN